MEHGSAEHGAGAAHEEGAHGAEHGEEGCHEEVLPPFSGPWFVYLGVVLGLTCFAGLCSGLTVGMLSINKLDLALKQKAGSDREKEMAELLLPILNEHHLLLATLLLANAFAMESLPIFLDALVPAWAAIVISTSLVLVFGEVIPQAYCTGPNQLQIATFMIPVVKLLICITYPITWPISYALDQILGHQGEIRYDKKNLKTLIEIHMGEGRLTEEEITIIKATIDLRETTVETIMIPMKDVFKLSDRTIISSEMLSRIIDKGFTRIPVYGGNNVDDINDVISAKSLLTALSQSGKLLGNLKAKGERVHPIKLVARDCNLQEALTMFQEYRVNMMFISDTHKEVKVVQKDNTGKVMNPPSRRDALVTKKTKILGMVHLKDVFETIIGHDLLDADMNAPVSGIQHQDRNYGQELREGVEGSESNTLKKRLMEHQG